MPGRGAADEVLVLAGDAHHHRRVGLFREQRRNRHRDGARNLAAEAAARELGNHHDLVGRDAGPARKRRDRLHRALRRAVQVALAVLPVRHRRARFERLVAGGLGHEGFVEDERGLLEPVFNVAVGPLVSGFTERQLTGLSFREVVLGPFPFGDDWRRWCAGSRATTTAATTRGSAGSCTSGRRRTRSGGCTGSGRRRGGTRFTRRRCAGSSSRTGCRRGGGSGCSGSGTSGRASGGVRAGRAVSRPASSGSGRRRSGTRPDVALRPRIRTARTQRFDWIHNEGKRFEFDVDGFDGECRGQLVDGSDRENRLALVQRLVGQAAFGLRRRLHTFTERRADGGAGHVLGSQDGLDAGYRHRGRRVDPLDACVRHRAHEQLREQHAFDAVVLGVLGLAGDLGDDVRRRVVLADQFVISHFRRSSCALRRASAPSESCRSPGNGKGCRRYRVQVLGASDWDWFSGSRWSP